MDFSKIKKIFYIVAIISMLLSIKSKVFGASYEYTFKDSQDTISLFPLSDYYVYCYGEKLNNSSYAIQLVVCDHEFLISDNNKNLAIPQNSYYSKITGTAPLSQINSFIQNFTQPEVLVSSSYEITPSYIVSHPNQTLFTNFDLKYENGTIYNPNNVSIQPFFANPEELEDAPENVFIELGDYSANDYLYFHLLEVTNIMPMSNNDSTYYYNDHTFALNKDSKYYTQLLDTTKYYYEIPRSALGLNPNTSYFYVLTNSSTQIDNSINPITEGDDIYDVIMQDTTGIITEDMATNDKLQNINQEFRDYQQQQEEFQNQNSIMPDTETDINSNMNFNNSAPSFSNMYGSFFSRLSSTISGLGSYDPTTVETINLPIPFTSNTIPLNSNMVSQHMPTILNTIFTTFWLFIFGKYFLAYILYIYRLISSGHILDNINSNNEIITNDVL